MDELYEYIEWLSDILQIKTPQLRVISEQEMKSLSQNEETIAAYDISTKTIFLIERDNYTIMDYYLLSHEIRHAWQDVVDPFFYFENYDFANENEYNVSYAEIDANAFACVAVAIAFNKITKRDYQNDTDAQLKYEKRLEQLKKQFEIEF